MSLTPGQKLTHHRLVEKIGEGGMGVVWKAIDLNLDRSVAIKILSEAFTGDAGRLARFEREARLLASLNHPNVASIHGLQEEGGVRFIVLELVSGRTLDEILATGPLRVEDATDDARQIAAGLEAAHERGVIHRDLKPSNIKLTGDGKIKLLDFGLAKAFTADAPGDSGGDISHSPTMTSGGTGAGVILGTVAYMSPEQARGRPVDKRTDIWAFGCVLWQMLTGRAPFAGETPSDTMAAILQNEPDWKALPDNTPARVRDLLRRCLEKDAGRRLRDIGDARLELDDAVAARAWSSPSLTITDIPEPVARQTGLVRRWVPRLALVTLGVLIGMVVWSEVSQVPAPVTRLSVTIPEHLEMRGFDLTPDGRTLLISARPVADTSEPAGERPPHAIYSRSLDRFEFHKIEGTEDPHFWAVSPDSRWVAFTSTAGNRKRLSKVRLSGGPPLTLWEGGFGEMNEFGFCGNDTILLTARGDTIPPEDGTIHNLPEDRTIQKISADGGRPELVASYDDSVVGEIEGIEALPGCEGAFVTRALLDEQGFRRQIDHLDVTSGKLTPLIDEGALGMFLPPDRVVFSRGSALLVAPYDRAAGRLGGSIQPVISGLHVSSSWEDALFRLTISGDLVYRPGGNAGAGRTLVAIDSNGNKDTLFDLRRDFEGDLRLSPDGRMAVVVIADARSVYQLWILDLARQTMSPVPAPDKDCSAPIRSPASDEIFFQVAASSVPSAIHRWPIDGTRSTDVVPEDADIGWLEPLALTQDGRTLIYSSTNRQDRTELRTLDLESGESDLLAENGTEAALSPDERWLAYITFRAGVPEVYVQSWPADGVARPTSSGAVGDVHWSTDGTRLFAERFDGQLVEATVSAGEELTVSPFRPLLDSRALGARRLDNPYTNYFTPVDGGGFAYIEMNPAERDRSRISVVLNFADELAARFPVEK